MTLDPTLSKQVQRTDESTLIYHVLFGIIEISAILVPFNDYRSTLVAWKRLLLSNNLRFSGRLSTLDIY